MATFVFGRLGRPLREISALNDRTFSERVYHARMCILGVLLVLYHLGDFRLKNPESVGSGVTIDSYFGYHGYGESGTATSFETKSGIKQETIIVLKTVV